MELFKLFGTIAINNSEANSALRQTTSEASASSEGIGNAFKKIGAAVATYFTIDKIVSFGKSCIQVASDAQEMQNKFDVVFQGMTDEVSRWAEAYADAMGRNSTAIKGYLADNQNMFVGMGMARDQAATLSEKLVMLSLDLASFNNLNETDAINAMSKALMGQSEAAKTLGAVLNENTIALAMEQLGYQGKFEALSEAEKMEVRYQAILMQSQDAVGDVYRSLDSYKGRTLQLKAAQEKLHETIGNMLLPTMTKLAEETTKLISGIQTCVEWGKEHETILQVIAIAIGTVVSAIVAYNIAQNALAIGTALATAATTAFGAVMAFVTSPVTLVVVAIGALIAIIVVLIKHWDDVKAVAQAVAQTVAEKWSEMKDRVSEAVSNMVSSVTEKFEAIKTGISDKINAARDAVKNAIDKIKSFMDFEFKLPHLPLPHFSVSPSGWKIGDLLTGSIPKLGVEWYAKGGIMTDPTIFGFNGNKAMIGGEAGDEAIAPIDTLKGYVSDAVASQNAGLIHALDKIFDAIVTLDEDMGGNLREALSGTSISINNREFGRLVRQVI